MEGLRLIVGLGNPGPEHARTRHNAGFRFVDALAEKSGERFKVDAKLFGETAKVDVGGRSVWLLNPATFMNLRGKSVLAAMRFWKIEPAQPLLAHDELDLPPGVARLKFDGGQHGRASCRGGGCQYVSVSVVVVSLPNNTTHPATMCTHQTKSQT